MCNLLLFSENKIIQFEMYILLLQVALTLLWEHVVSRLGESIFLKSGIVESTACRPKFAMVIPLLVALTLIWEQNVREQGGSIFLKSGIVESTACRPKFAMVIPLLVALTLFWEERVIFAMAILLQNPFAILLQEFALAILLLSLAIFLHVKLLL